MSRLASHLPRLHPRGAFFPFPSSSRSACGGHSPQSPDVLLECPTD